MHPKTVIVVPCYNEANRLEPEHFVAFLSRHPQINLIMVNDGSVDATREVLESIRSEISESCTLLNLKQNSGKGEAVRRGILQALSSGAAYVGYWDADLSTPLETIPDFCNLLNDTPHLLMVFGARVLLLGKIIERNALRHYCGRGFATFVSQVLKLKVYDTQCGAKLFRTRPEIKRLFQDPFISRWIFDVEIIARWIRLGQTEQLPPADQVIYEYPLPVWRHVPDSKISFSDGITVARDLYKIHRFLKGDDHLR